jgi:hypothetical protein
MLSMMAIFSFRSYMDTVLGYIDNAEPFDNHAAERLLLSSKSHDESPVSATANSGLTGENSDDFDSL